MLVELSVRDLGVIASARIPLGTGLIALTGETGAGKTMLVDALHLLLGERGDPDKVRRGAPEAVVEGLFAVEDQERVLARVVPKSGRSRASVDGSLSTAGTLAELGESLLEVNGQHSQRSLLSARTRREALDRFAGIDRGDFDAARREWERCRSELESHGGDEHSRAREIDLCRFQVEEIDSVAPVVGEDDALSEEEDLLAAAHELRRAARLVGSLLGDDGAAIDLVARSEAALGDATVFEPVAVRLRDVAAELGDCAAELRNLGDQIEPDEERLAAVRSRRHRLVELRRKYGDTIESILEFRDETAARLDQLEHHDELHRKLESDLSDARRRLDEESERVGASRRRAAPRLARAIEQRLADLALAGARVEVEVADTEQLPSAGERVEFLIAVNAGLEPGPLSKVASGGELSRVMLALRLVLSEGPPTMVFDEIDAGIGGAAALAVGRALAELGREHQVLVVTHLAQVAAFADQQIRIEKSTDGVTTSTTVAVLDDAERVVELSRMLSGSPDSEAARRHASELLEQARIG